MRRICLLLLILCMGCASANTVEYTSDAQGRWVRTVYTKGYISSKTELSGGVMLVITGLDEGKVNPVAAAVGALGPESETPPASYVLHFKNTSDAPIDLELGTFKVGNVEYPLEPKTMTIEPDKILDSGKIMGTVSLWSHDVVTEVSLKVSGQAVTKTVVLKQETQEAFNARMKRYQDSLKTGTH